MLVSSIALHKCMSCAPHISGAELFFFARKNAHIAQSPPEIQAPPFVRIDVSGSGSTKNAVNSAPLFMRETRVAGCACAGKKNSVLYTTRNAHEQM